MKHAVLLRSYTSLEGTPGELWIKQDAKYIRFLASLELPWLNNLPSVSCIPSGLYLVTPTYSPKYKRIMYLVEAVPNRSGIRCHSANFAGSLGSGYRCDLLGCIAFGTRLFGGPGTGTQLMLQNSRFAMRKFRDLFNGEQFLLSIVGDFPCPAS